MLAGWRDRQNKCWNKNSIYAPPPSTKSGGEDKSSGPADAWLRPPTPPKHPSAPRHLNIYKLQWNEASLIYGAIKTCGSSVHTLGQGEVICQATFAHWSDRGVGFLAGLAIQTRQCILHVFENIAYRSIIISPQECVLSSTKRWTCQNKQKTSPGTNSEMRLFKCFKSYLHRYILKNVYLDMFR